MHREVKSVKAAQRFSHVSQSERYLQINDLTGIVPKGIKLNE
jgi:hypothetical protein